MAVFAEAMGGTDRMVRVVSTQTGVKGGGADLTAPLAVAEGLPLPVESFDARAVTGIRSPRLRGQGAGGEGLDSPKPRRRNRKRRRRARLAALEDHVAAHRYDLALERAVAELRNGGSTGAGVCGRGGIGCNGYTKTLMSLKCKNLSIFVVKFWMLMEIVEGLTSTLHGHQAIV